MKRYLLLILLAVTLTSCPHYEPEIAERISIVKFARSEYAKYVLGNLRNDSVETYFCNYQNYSDSVILIELCDGWWYFNAIEIPFDRQSALGETTWEELLSLPQEVRLPLRSGLKDAHPIIDITDISLVAGIGGGNTSASALHPCHQNDSSAIVIWLREIISSGQLDKYRDDWWFTRN